MLGAGLGVLLREMMARDAADGGAGERMALADIMAGDTADDRTLDAALRVGGSSSEGHGKG